MKLKNTFVDGKINLDTDERLLPKGQYPYASNIRIGNTDGSDIGAIETVRGNKLIEDLGLTNGKCIGGYTDSANRKLYWFVTSDEWDLVIEYNENDGNVHTLLKSTPITGVLNFDKNFLITGINKVINDDLTKDLLAWTDNLNPPRIINIERSYNEFGDTEDSFIEEDISVIKKPPLQPPTTTLKSTSTLENYLDNKFISFAYRYKYLDGGYSALSHFTSYQFFPKKYKLDYQVLENIGMENVFNEVDLDFLTGSKRVTDVQLVFRESSKTQVYVIETLNKDDEGWGDDETKTYTFNNSKKYAPLPSDELSRLFDNVPLLAKSQELVGNRLNYGNYVEGYNLVDSNNNKVVEDYNLSLVSNNIAYTSLSYILSADNADEDVIRIDVYGLDLVKDLVLNFNITFSRYQGAGSFTYVFSYILPEDYADAADLVASGEFVYFVEEVMTSVFINEVDVDPPTGTTATEYTGFKITTGNSWQIPILAPFITYTVDNDPDPDTTEFHYWDFVNTATDMSFSQVGSNRSLKSNRSYEVGKVYIDSNNRSSTVLTDNGNTIFIPHNLSTSQNLISVEINQGQMPPEWATGYKFVIKQNKGDYDIIYINRFYEDGLYRWCKLEGTNKDKVKEGDTLIVKSDYKGAVESLIKVRVLDVALKQSNFILNNEDVDGGEIIEEDGLYMKIKPVGFSMDLTDSLIQPYYDYDLATVSGDGVKMELGNKNTTLNSNHDSLGGIQKPDETWEDLPIRAGTRVRFDLTIQDRPAGGGGLYTEFKKEYIVQQTYDNFQDWFEVEVVDFGFDFESQIAAPTGVNPRFRRDLTNNLTLQYTANSGVAPECRASVDIIHTQGDLIFETEASDIEDEIFYETGEVFSIEGGVHKGNIQDQIIEQTSGVLVVGKKYIIDTFEIGDDFTNVGGDNISGNTFIATNTTPTVWSNGSIITAPAVCLLNAFNCYVMGNGVESYKHLDSFNTNSLEMNLRPNLVDLNGYKAVRRYADITYSEPYNENSSLNGLNEFNLSRANWKDDIEKKYGSIQKLYARDTDVVVFQEDKVSYILFGKDVLYNADGSSNVSQINDVLGRQVAYAGEYGISDNPESFAFDAKTLYWTDSKRGAVLKLGGNGIYEISQTGLRTWFKDKFRDSDDLYKLGVFDPYYDQYVLSFAGKESKEIDNTDSTLTFDERAKGWTSFHSFSPDFMLSMNNGLYSFDNGNLYIHHDPDNGSVNNYYGETFLTKAAVMINDEPSIIKNFQSISLEGSTPLDCIIKSYITSKGDFIESKVMLSEFLKKEGLWYAYLRRNENDEALDAKSVYGIGKSASTVDANQITFTGDSYALTSGDRLYTLLDGNLELVGTMDTIIDNVITLVEASPLTTPTIGSFLMGRKNARIEGGNLRGYTARVDISLTPEKKEELYAVNLEIAKSSE